jgi:hypothetical protein
VIRLLAIAAAFGCQNGDKDRGPGVYAESTHQVVLRLAPDAIELEGKDGKHTYKLDGAPTPALVQPVVDKIKAEGGTVVIWGRYDSPEVYNALAPALSDIPTTICLRDGANC